MISVYELEDSLADGTQIIAIFSIGMGLIGLWIISIALMGLGFAIKKPKLESIGMILIGISAVITPILLFTRENYVISNLDVIISCLMGVLSGLILVLGIARYRKIRNVAHDTIPGKSN